MTSTTQLSSKDDPDHPLNLLPIPELNADLSNFSQWDHAVTFHLRYHNLLGYVGCNSPKEPTTEEECQIQEMQKLHAYSLIASKIEKILPEFAKDWGRPLFGDRPGCFHLNPRILWADIHLFGAPGE